MKPVGRCLVDSAKAEATKMLRTMKAAKAENCELREGGAGRTAVDVAAAPARVRDAAAEGIRAGGGAVGAGAHQGGGDGDLRRDRPHEGSGDHGEGGVIGVPLRIDEI